MAYRAAAPDVALYCGDDSLMPASEKFKKKLKFGKINLNKLKKN
jgi:hypothetical protein